jgi:hypothetical protein
MQRQSKAGEWPPLAQLYSEIAIRMQKEWKVQDRAASEAVERRLEERLTA